MGQRRGVETSFKKNYLEIVIGVGLNVLMKKSHQPAIEKEWTSIFYHTKKYPDRNRLSGLILDSLLSLINNFKKQNYLSVVGTFRIQDDNNSEIYLKPELRIFNQPAITTSEADIKTSFYSDKFLVMNLVKGSDFYNIRYQTKPFMMWIWLSALLLATGGLVNFFYKKKK